MVVIDYEEGGDKPALMVMDSDDEKDHFNFNDIVESETKSGKSKKKWKKKKKELEIPAEDSFALDVTDDRYSALFSRLDIRLLVFSEGQLYTIDSYMDHSPF